jgi:hypothetical protein
MSAQTFRSGLNIKIKNIPDFVQFINSNKKQSKFEINFIRNQVKSTTTIDKIGDISQL